MTEHDGLFILAPKRKSSFQQTSKSGLVSGHTEKQSVISKLGAEREESGEMKGVSLTARSNFQ